MNTRNLVVATLLVCAGGASLADGLKDNGTDWHLAHPTGGKFSVLLPCPSSERSVKSESGAVINARIVSCMPSKNMLFAAEQLEYANPEIAAQWFAKMAATPGAQPVASTPLGYGGRKTIVPVPPQSLVNLTGTSRAVLAGSVIVIVDVEWRPVEDGRVKPLLQKFLDSLRIEN